MGGDLQLFGGRRLGGALAYCDSSQAPRSCRQSSLEIAASCRRGPKRRQVAALQGVDELQRVPQRLTKATSNLQRRKAGDRSPHSKELTIFNVFPND